MTIRHSCAYRHTTGEVEGFVGYSSGFGPRERQVREATADAVHQIARKLAITGHPYDPNRFIDTTDSLTKDEFERVKKDWASNLRY